MHFKKITALLIAFLMLMSSASFSFITAEADTAPAERTDGGTRYVNPGYINTKGCLLEYSDFGSVPCTTGATSTHSYVQINGGGAHSTNGFESIEFAMKEGDRLIFEFWYSTELNYDFFNFISHARSGGDALEEQISGSTGGEDTWFMHTFTAPATDWYSFSWEYTKDGSNDSGADCVRISNLYLMEHWNYERAEAMTKPGTSLFEYDFNNASINGFKAMHTTSSTSHPSWLRSGNAGIANSTCSVTLSGRTRECTLKFEYAVQCEAPSGSSYYDYFEVIVDGQSVLQEAGDHWEWTTFSYDLSSGWHEIEFRYVKDGSVNTGYDCVDLDNVEIVYPSGEAVSRWHEINRLGSSANKIYFNTPIGTSGWGAKENSDGSNVRGYSGNRYLDGESSSFCETMINMAQGESISFEYVVSSQYYDTLNFYVNGELEAMLGGGWTDRFWSNHSYTAPRTGTYYFRWEYKKHDNSYPNEGWDYAYIRSLTYSGSYNQSLNIDQLLLTESSAPMHFYTSMANGDGFQPCSLDFLKDGSDDYGVVSRNRYMEYTRATIEGQAGQLSAGDLLHFDYFVSSETNYDNLIFTVKKNGTTVHTETITGSPEGEHRYREYSVPSAGNYTFIWEYSKDSSVDRGDDCAIIYGVSLYKYGDTGIPGDVDDNGTVNMVDAILALRKAMELMTLTPDQEARADVDGNGSVTIADAVMILRLSMGL